MTGRSGWEKSLGKSGSGSRHVRVNLRYLPADFGWKHLTPIIANVKKTIENGLEHRAEEVFKRHTPFVRRGMDFRKKHPDQGFDDVGDFDVLAYWPETNFLVVCECKYNQPAHTMKDTRRLRDRIFGRDASGKDGQFVHIEARRRFLAERRERMIELLAWPASQVPSAQDVEVYVCRDIYFWMVHPPYKVPTQFVRIDALDTWVGRLRTSPEGPGRKAE